jgi:hypothetical protein
MTGPRFWDAPHPGLVADATLPQLVDRLTAHVEQEIVRTLGANAFLRLQIADKALMDRTWHLLPNDETWVPHLKPCAAAEVGDTVTIADAARLTGIASKRLYRAVAKGKLTVVHVSGAVKSHLKLTEIEQWRKTQ